MQQIVTHAPLWVFGLFVVLVALGANQLLRRRVSLRRASALPLVMVALSLQGAVAGPQSGALLRLALWAAVGAAAFALVARRPVAPGTAYDPATRRFDLPGSWVPLALLLAVFCAKFAVGAETAMHPELRTANDFTLGIAALYGAFSGLFLGRAARLWSLAMRSERALPRDSAQPTA